MAPERGKKADATISIKTSECSLMNNLQPYEKHVAEKLQQVPVPDKEQGWEQMRKLLDRDLPEGGGGWNGNSKRWWMALTVGVIITGIWLSQKFSAVGNDRKLSEKVIARSDPSSTNKPSSNAIISKKSDKAQTTRDIEKNSPGLASTKDEEKSGQAQKQGSVNN